jgi:hypothetical protein
MPTVKVCGNVYHKQINRMRLQTKQQPCRSGSQSILVSGLSNLRLLKLC